MKGAAGELAILGGAPAFAEPLHVGRPNIGDPEAVLRTIGEAMQDRWLSNQGAKLEEFERRLSERLGGLHCVATCNATLGLQILLRALDVTGEVVLPSFTFVATPHAVEWERLTPVFADVEAESLCMGPAEAAAQVRPETGALLGVHLWGRSADLGGLEQLARERELPLLFDAAHALGCVRDGRSLTSFGTASVLSFHATKVANSFEGGAVVTADEELAERLQTMRNFGFVDDDEVVGLGTNAKMSEAAAAMGLASLQALDGFLADDRRNFGAYEEVLRDVPGVRLLTFEPHESFNCHHVTVLVDPAAGGLDRDALRAVLVAENVLARRYFYPGCHRMPPYSERPTPALPVTEAIVDRCLSLPTGSVIGPAEIETIGEIIRLANEDAVAVQRRLGG